MTFDQVIVFHRIIQLGSFKAAADDLHKTQPAISLSIKKLESEMEVQLFDRSGYRLTLSDHGKAFYERSAKVMQGMQELEGLSQSFRNGEEPEVSVAIDGISPLPEILNVFKNFSLSFPHTKLNLGLDILSEAERRVLSKEAQMGVTHFIGERSILEIVPITFIRMLPVMSKDLYLEKKVKRQEQLLEIEQIVVGDRNGPKGASFGLLDGGKKWRLNHADFKRDIIVAGLGWGHLPEHQIERELKEKKLVVLEFEEIKPKKLDINLIRLKKNKLGSVASALWEELLSLKQEN